MDDRLTEKQLLAAARRNGCPVSPDQLKRWRQADLIPRPDQIHPAGSPGSAATYPPGTLTQLLAVCELRKRFRTLVRIRFELWWSGRDVGDLARIRTYLVGRLEPLFGEVRELRDRYDDPFDAAEAAVSGPVRSRDPVLRTMRRLAKTDENLRSAALAVFLNLFGGDVPWESADVGLDEREPSLVELVERVSGIYRAKTDLLESGQPLVDQSADIVTAIEQAHQVIDLDHPGQAIDHATDDQLTQARDQARVFLEGMGAMVQLYTVTRGRDFAGLSIFGRVITPDPTTVALIVELFISLPRLLETEEEQANLANTLKAFALNAVKLRCTQLFIQEHPGYAFMFSADGPDRVRSLPADERALIVTRFDEFVRRHPECSVLSDSEE